MMKRLNEMKVPEMKAECKSLNIPNYSKMKKGELILALSQARESNGHVAEKHTVASHKQDKGR